MIFNFTVVFKSLDVIIINIIIKVAYINILFRGRGVKSCGRSYVTSIHMTNFNMSHNLWVRLISIVVKFYSGKIAITSL